MGDESGGLGFTGAPTDVVSSVRCEVHGSHAHVDVWSRGGKAGTLVVGEADARDVVDRLRGVAGAAALWRVSEGGEKMQTEVSRVHDEVEAIAKLIAPLALGDNSVRLLEGVDALQRARAELADITVSLGDWSTIAGAAARGTYSRPGPICAWCGYESTGIDDVNDHIKSCPKRESEAEKRAHTAIEIAQHAMRALASSPHRWADGKARAGEECTPTTPCETHELVALLARTAMAVDNDQTDAAAAREALAAKLSNTKG